MVFKGISETYFMFKRNIIFQKFDLSFFSRSFGSKMDMPLSLYNVMVKLLHRIFFQIVQPEIVVNIANKAFNLFYKAFQNLTLSCVDTVKPVLSSHLREAQNVAA